MYSNIVNKLLAFVIIIFFIGRVIISRELVTHDLTDPHLRGMFINGIGGFYMLIITTLLLFIRVNIVLNEHLKFFVNCALVFAVLVGTLTWYPFLPDTYAYYIGTYFFLPLWQACAFALIAFIVYFYQCIKNKWFNKVYTV